jgi:hypothetical protein
MMIVIVNCGRNIKPFPYSITKDRSYNSGVCRRQGRAFALTEDPVTKRIGGSDPKYSIVILPKKAIDRVDNSSKSGIPK